jgi:hypothetical protein
VSQPLVYVDSAGTQTLKPLLTDCAAKPAPPCHTIPYPFPSRIPPRACSRLQQGYHPDRAGKLEKDEATPELTPAAAGATGGAFTRSVNGSGSSSSAAAASSSSAAASAAGIGGGKGGKKGGATSAKSGTAALIEAGKGHVPGRATNAESDADGGAAGSSSAAAGGGPRSAEEEAAAAAASAGEAVGVAGTSSVFHGRELRDYQGRSWVEPPKGLRADGGDHECFLPKKAVHKYTGAWRGSDLGG